VGAAKHVDAERLEAYIAAGLGDLGENYVQEALPKISALAQRGLFPHWHFIGALQSNKAAEAVENFGLIHTVDRVSLARAVQKAAAALGKTQEVLVQVNLGGESSKAGVSPDGLQELLQFCRGLPNLRLRGLMSLPPPTPDAALSRPYHEQLAQLRRDMVRALGLPAEQFSCLSMGMSHDFEVAIKAGATHVRIGTALFGKRG
jgi:pyridoxal phosphate enzyme (YggS family)